jgi:hypothetical protein
MKMRSITLSCCLLLASACADPLYLMHEEYWLEDGEERYIGGACQEVSEDVMSGTGTGGDGPDYAITMTGLDEGVRVVVTGEDGDTLEERTYDEAFLSSGEPDSFVVRSGGVEFLRLKLWGGTTCQSPREPEE